MKKFLGAVLVAASLVAQLGAMNDTADQNKENCQNRMLKLHEGFTIPFHAYTEIKKTYAPKIQKLETRGDNTLESLKTLALIGQQSLSSFIRELQKMLAGEESIREIEKILAMVPAKKEYSKKLDPYYLRVYVDASLQHNKAGRLVFNKSPLSPSSTVNANSSFK